MDMSDEPTSAAEVVAQRSPLLMGNATSSLLRHTNGTVTAEVMVGGRNIKTEEESMAYPSRMRRMLEEVKADASIREVSLSAACRVLSRCSLGRAARSRGVDGP